MNVKSIDKAFKELIEQRGIYKKLGVSSGLIRTYRYNLVNAISISTDTKLDLLKKSGWREDDQQYTRKDLISLLNFYKKTSETARNAGPEYVIEKWEAKK